MQFVSRTAETTTSGGSVLLKRSVAGGKSAAYASLLGKVNVGDAASGSKGFPTVDDGDELSAIAADEVEEVALTSAPLRRGGSGSSEGEGSEAAVRDTPYACVGRGSNGWRRMHSSVDDEEAPAAPGADAGADATTSHQSQPARPVAAAAGRGAARGRRKGTELPSVHDDFMPSVSFAGARPGFVFRAGDHGTGYYRDATAPGLRATGFTADEGSHGARQASGAEDVGKVDNDDEAAAVARLRSARAPPSTTLRRDLPSSSLAEAEAAWDAVGGSTAAAVDVSDSPSGATAAVTTPSPPATAPPKRGSPARRGVATSRALGAPSDPQSLASAAPPARAPPPAVKQGVLSVGDGQLMQHTRPDPPDGSRSSGKVAAIASEATSTVEFGSMKLDASDSSSSEEDDESEPEDQHGSSGRGAASSSLPPSRPIRALYAQRGGADDSDGEVEFG